eukprot:591380-Pleurochrysis_carterae.AAC.1
MVGLEPAGCFACTAYSIGEAEEPVGREASEARCCSKVSGELLCHSHRSSLGSPSLSRSTCGH